MSEFRVMTEADKDFLLSNHAYDEQKTNPMFTYCESFAYEHEGKLLGGGGFVMITETTAWAWATVTDEIRRHSPSAFRIMREYIEKWCREHGILRLQAFVKQGFTEGRRLVMHLDFVPEGEPMKDFCGPGVAAQLYVRLFEE